MTTFEEEAFGVKVSDLYKPYNDGMGPAIDETVSAIKTLCPTARAILDLGSGHGEPGCTIAAAFPDASVICSDLAPSMLRLAAQRAGQLYKSSRIQRWPLVRTHCSNLQTNLAKQPLL